MRYKEVDVFTLGMDLDAFRQDAKTIRAVELNFIVIGEAATRIPADIQTAHADIPWHLMRGMRNRIVHAYFSVDPAIVWETIQTDLPNLVKPLTDLPVGIPIDSP